MSDKFIIVGNGGHARSVSDIALELGLNITAYVDETKNNDSTLKDYPIYSKFEKIKTCDELAHVFIAIGVNNARQKKFDIISAYKNISFPTLIHPKALISQSAIIGRGTVIMPGAIIGPNVKVGDFCIVNTGACIDHDGIVEDFVSLAPGVTLGGGVTVGSRSAIGIGASIKHQVNIANDVVVGAQSYVNKDLRGNIVAFGVPARIVRDRKSYDPYL